MGFKDDVLSILSDIDDEVRDLGIMAKVAIGNINEEDYTDAISELSRLVSMVEKISSSLY